MPAESSDIKNKRIAKNTLLLYVRTFCTMIISLFTSRLTLEALGVDNFGVYNVVGGFVGLFSIFSGTITGSISRFITYGLGTGDQNQLKITFSTSVNVQLLLCLLIIIIGETVGLWFLNHELNIPPGRIYAAHWVLQCSILTFCFGLLSAPYNACIIAHEKMGVFAYMTILDVTIKLLFVYLLFVTPFDTLITYAVALTLIGLFNRIIYGWYCIRHFEECRYQAVLDKKLLKEMSSFSGWSFLGNTAYLLNTQGVNMAINIFFGVALNAARGIVTQVEGAVMTLINNFTMAFNPQITKSFAEGEQKYMFLLMCRGAKFSTYLLLYFLIPLEFNAGTVLALWLKEVPAYSPMFLRLSLICTAVMLIGNPFLTGILAHGKIRNYELATTIIGCLVFPLTLVAFQLGAPAQSFYWFFIIIYNFLNGVKIYFAHKLLGFPPALFWNKVMLPILSCVSITLVPVSIVSFFLTDGITHLCMTTIVSSLFLTFAIYTTGLDITEKEKARNYTTSIRHKICLRLNK